MCFRENLERGGEREKALRVFDVFQRFMAGFGGSNVYINFMGALLYVLIVVSIVASLFSYRRFAQEREREREREREKGLVSFLSRSWLHC